MQKNIFSYIINEFYNKLDESDRHKNQQGIYRFSKWLRIVLFYLMSASVILTLIWIGSTLRGRLEYKKEIFIAVCVMMVAVIVIILRVDKKRENDPNWYLNRVLVFKSVIEDDVFSLKSLEQKQKVLEELRREVEKNNNNFLGKNFGIATISALTLIISASMEAFANALKPIDFFQMWTMLLMLEIIGIVFIFVFMKTSKSLEESHIEEIYNMLRDLIWLYPKIEELELRENEKSYGE